MADPKAGLLRTGERLALLGLVALAYGRGRRRHRQDEHDAATTASADAAKPEPPAPVDVAAQLTKIAGVAALVTYTVGLIIVNASLFSLGVSEFELFRPRFIATGALVVAIITMSTLAVAGTGWMLWRLVLGRGTPPGSDGPPVWVRGLFLANAAITLAFPFGALLLLGESR